MRETLFDLNDMTEISKLISIVLMFIAVIHHDFIVSKSC